MSRKLDLKDKEFHRLTVLKKSEDRTKYGQVKWWCQCSCGSEPFKVRGDHLVGGNILSCGCVHKERVTTHGEAGKTSEYCTWYNMKTRCLNENNVEYHNYGGRGISVCDRWLDSYENFLEDMGRKPGKTYTLDRKDNDGDYTPENCRWATKKEQGRNKRTNRLLTHNGVTQTMKEWSEELKLNYNTLIKRLRMGWDIEKALTTPVRKRN